MGTILSQTGGGWDEREKQVLQNQLEKYNRFVERAQKNDAYDMAHKELEDLRTEIFNEMDIKETLIHFSEVFNMLQEHRFPVGNSQSPGPGDAFKVLFMKYIE